MIHLLVAAAVLLFAIQAFAGADCAPRDFFAIPVPARAESPEIDALRIAYPDLVISSDGAQIAFPGSEWIPLGSRTRGSPQRLLTEPSVVDQFAYVYPLDMGLEERKQPWHDPGRVRNDAFFRARYFGDEASAARTLARVSAPPLADVSFSVTNTGGVACQLQGALDALSANREEYAPYFEASGGSFTWRTIAGTSRLSAHSFGIAIDVNPELGQYWRWTGAAAGQVPEYRNRIPARIVTTMERHGFIWGGKWHHSTACISSIAPNLSCTAEWLPVNLSQLAQSDFCREQRT